MHHPLPPLHSASSYLQQHSGHHQQAPPSSPSTPSSYHHQQHGYYNSSNNNYQSAYHSPHHHSSAVNSSMNGGSSSVIYHSSSSSLYGSDLVSGASGSNNNSYHHHSPHHLSHHQSTPTSHHSHYQTSYSNYHNATTTSSQPAYNYGNTQDHSYNYQQTSNNYSHYNNTSVPKSNSNNVQTPTRRTTYEESTPVTVISSDEEESQYKTMKTSTSTPNLSKSTHHYGLQSPNFQSTPPSASYAHHDLNSPSSSAHQQQQYQPSYTSSNNISSSYYQHSSGGNTGGPPGSLEDKFLSMKSSMMVPNSRRSPSPPLPSPRLANGLPSTPSSAVNTTPSSYTQPLATSTPPSATSYAEPPKPAFSEPLKTNSRKALDEMMSRLQRERESLQQFRTTSEYSYPSSYPSTTATATTTYNAPPTYSHDPYYSNSSTYPPHYSNYASKYDENYRGSYYQDEYHTPPPSHGSHPSYHSPYVSSDPYYRNPKYPPLYSQNSETISDDAPHVRSTSPTHVNGSGDKKKHHVPPSSSNNRKKPPTVTKKPKHKIPPPPSSAANIAPPTPNANTPTPGSDKKSKLPPKPKRKESEANLENNEKSPKTNLNLRVRTNKQKKRQQDAVRMLKQDDSDNEIIEMEDEKQESYQPKPTKSDEDKSKDLETDEKENEVGDNFVFSRSSMALLSETADMTTKCTDYINYELEKKGLSVELTSEEQDIIDLAVYNIVTESKKPNFIKTPVASTRKPHKKFLKFSADNINSSITVNDSGETIKKGLLKKGPGLDVYEIVCAAKLEKINEEDIKKECEGNHMLGQVEYSDSEDEPKGVNLRSDNTGLKSILGLIENGAASTLKSNESLFSANIEKVLEMYSLKRKSITKDIKLFEKLKPANAYVTTGEPRVEPSPKKKSSPKRSAPEPKKKEEDQKSKKRKFDVLKKYNTRNGSKD